jgi:ABC-type sugar transport system substrate-binding protein
MAADWLAKKTGGKGSIVELQGTPGSAPANERRKAFADALAKHPGSEDHRLAERRLPAFGRQGSHGGIFEEAWTGDHRRLCA